MVMTLRLMVITCLLAIVAGCKSLPTSCKNIDVITKADNASLEDWISNYNKLCNCMEDMKASGWSVHDTEYMQKQKNRDYATDCIADLVIQGMETPTTLSEYETALATLEECQNKYGDTIKLQNKIQAFKGKKGQKEEEYHSYEAEYEVAMATHKWKEAHNILDKKLGWQKPSEKPENIKGWCEAVKDYYQEQINKFKADTDRENLEKLMEEINQIKDVQIDGKSCVEDLKKAIEDSVEEFDTQFNDHMEKKEYFAVFEMIRKKAIDRSEFDRTKAINHYLERAGESVSKGDIARTYLDLTRARLIMNDENDGLVPKNKGFNDQKMEQAYFAAVGTIESQIPEKLGIDVFKTVNNDDQSGLGRYLTKHVIGRITSNNMRQFVILDGSENADLSACDFQVTGDITQFKVDSKDMGVIELSYSFYKKGTYEKDSKPELLDRIVPFTIKYGSSGYMITADGKTSPDENASVKPGDKIDLETQLKELAVTKIANDLDKNVIQYANFLNAAYNNARGRKKSDEIQIQAARYYCYCHDYCKKRNIMVEEDHLKQSLKALSDCDGEI